jgi:hypothetical protein
MTYPNLKEAAAAMAESFEQRTRANGESFYALKDEAPDWMTDALYEAHNGILPDDWAYSAARSLVNGLADIDSDDTAESVQYNGRDSEIIDSCVDVYTGRLTAWLASHLARVAYCDDAAEEYGEPGDMIKRIAQGQYYELSQIFNAILSACEAQVTDSDDDSSDAESEQ